MSGRAIVIVSGLLVLMASGCAKAPSTVDASASALPAATRDGTGTGTGMGTGTAGYSSDRPDPKDYLPVSEMPDIHFDFDKYAVRPDATRVLNASVVYLKERPKALLMIEGHCDERGTGEYNFALGERRAKATKDYLVSHGVDARRIAVVSFGEEKPECREHSKACWAKNRRAHFLVKPE